MTYARNTVEAVLRQHSGYRGTLHDETKLGDKLLLDSLDLIELAMLLEDEFGINIPDRDVDTPELSTFGGLVSYVQGKVDEQVGVNA